MNVTATKSTKKKTAPETARKASPKAASVKTGANAKPSGAAVLKSAAGKLMKSLAHAFHPASTATTKDAKPAAARSQKNTPRTGKAATTAAAPAKPAARQRVSGATTTKTAKAVTPATGMASAQRPAVGKVAQTTPAASQKNQKIAVKTASQAPQPGARLRNNNATVGIMDKIEKTVVSKVSEVATKTPKPTPAIPADGTLLTEAQIVKMGEKDYMNAAQRAFFKARLQQLERDLLKNADETTEHLRETVLVPDPADRATIEEEHALELRTRDRERKLLKKIQQSIASIDSGDYGWCEETGEPIGVARLLARPTATLSLEAQQRRELKQKLYGD